MKGIRMAAGGLAALSLVSIAPLAAAQAYPTKPVRVVVSYPPGGGTDILARPIMARMTELVGQSFLVDNRGGATGMIGSDVVAKSPPDGYTVLFSASPELVINRSLYPKMAYDSLVDLKGVTQVAITPCIILSIPSLPAKTINDVIALGRKHKGDLTYGTSGIGSPHHLVGELIRLRTGAEMTHVPYKGGGPQPSDTLGGHVIISIFTLPVATPHVQSGRLRGLAVTVPKRSPAVPNVPTMDETGFPGFDISQWFAMSVPKGTPDAIVKRLHAAVAEALKTPAIQKRQIEQGYEPIGSSPEVYQKYIRDEVAKYAKLIKDTGIKLKP